MNRVLIIWRKTKGNVKRATWNRKKEYLVLDKVLENITPHLGARIDWLNNIRYSLEVQGVPASFYL